MKKRVNKKKPLTTLILIIMILLLATIYYLINANKLDRRSNLIGDKVCKSFADQKGQDDCCTNFHKDDITIQCVGKWEYINGLEKCQYVCVDSLPSCPEDTLVCPDDSVVHRNPELECNFDSCK